MKLSRKYWLLQALGWGASTAPGLFYATRRPGWRPGVVIGSAESDEFVLHVENTGQAAGASPSDPQIGLHNIRVRLRLIYGSRAGLHLRNAGGNRVVDLVRTPAAVIT